MGDWWIIGDNAGLGCPSSVEFLAVWDNGDWYASDVERLRLTAGFCSSMAARSAACSTAARRCINNLLLLSFAEYALRAPMSMGHLRVEVNGVPYLLEKPEAGSTRSEHFVGSTQAARSDRYVGNRAGSGCARSLQTDKRLLVQ